MFSLLVLPALAPGLTGCTPLPLMAAGGALGGTAVMTDRRTSAVQLEDQTIELKAGNRIREVVGDRAHVSITSYNRAVVLTGEIFKEEDRGAIEQAVKKVDGVRSVSAEDLAVSWPSSASERSNDALLTTKVKLSLADAMGLTAGAIKVVTDRKVSYIYGRLTEAEASKAVDVARGVQGVVKVVRVVEVITADELKAILGK